MSRLLLRMGAFELILAFFPYCRSPKIPQVPSDMLDTNTSPAFTIAPTRMTREQRRDARTTSYLGVCMAIDVVLTRCDVMSCYVIHVT